MGFTTGFTSGVTLTLGIAYLTILAHERNRRDQGANLRSQSSLLNTLLLSDPSLAYPDPDAEVGRTNRATLVETAKDRWNEEIQNAVRWVQGANWGDVKEGMEDKVAKMLGTGMEKSRKEISEAEERAGPIAREAIERAREGVRMGYDGSKAAAGRAAARTLSAGNEREARFEGKTEYGMENASAVARAAWEKGAEVGRAVGAREGRSEEKTEHGLENASAVAREAWKRGTEAAHVVDPRESRFEGKTEHGLENASAVARAAWEKSVEKSHEVAEGLKLTEKAVVNAAKGTLERGTEAAHAVDPRESRFEGKTEHGFENSSAAAKEAWRKGVEKEHEIAQGLELTGKSVAKSVESTVHKDVSKVAEVAEGLKLTGEGVAGAVKRTIGQEKEDVQKVKTYVGEGSKRARGRDEADDGLTDVQRALRQRYAKSTAFNKSVPETLAERYTPIDERTNTSLRGL